MKKSQSILSKNNKNRIKSINALTLIAILVFAIVVVSFDFYVNVYRELIVKAGFVGLLLYWTYINRHIRNLMITISPARLWFIGLLLLASLSFFWSSNVGFFLAKYFLWLSAATLFFLVLSLKKTMPYVLLSRALIFSALYIACIGLMQVFFNADMFTQVAIPAANFINKNMAAHVVVLVFPLGLFLLLVDKNKRLFKLYPYVIAIILAYIFHTNTRSAWMSIGLEIILFSGMLIFYRHKLNKALSLRKIYWDQQQTLNSITALGLLLVLINFSSDGFTPFWEALVTNTESLIDRAQDTQSARYKIWNTALVMIQQMPLFGNGLGSFYHNILTQSAEFTGKVQGATEAHNDILELGVELGVVGWFLFFGIVVSLSIHLLRLIGQDKIQEKLFYIAVGVALAGSFLNMQFSFVYQMPVPLMIFSLYGALIVSAGDEFSQKLKRITLKLKPVHWHLSIISIIIILILMLSTSISWLVVVSKISNNEANNRWISPIDNTVLDCNKLVVRTIHLKALRYAPKNPLKSLKILESFNQCIPNAWEFFHLQGINLVNLGRSHEAIQAFEQAKLFHSKGVYGDYTNQFVIYYKSRDREGIEKIYRELSVEPVELLTMYADTLYHLVAMSVTLQHSDQALKFYKLYVSHYGENQALKTLFKTK